MIGRIICGEYGDYSPQALIERNPQRATHREAHPITPKYVEVDIFVVKLSPVHDKNDELIGGLGTGPNTLAQLERRMMSQMDLTKA